MAPNISRYRADIDGLRAVAVAAVIGFHAFPQLAPGGYAGVDVFFVISGFLISSIILADLQAGRFSFSDFYFRRARRLLPALAVVLAACLAIGWFVLVQTEFLSLERHIAAGATFVSNLVLWRDTGYFDAPAEAKPLLHLWSLGVEEQFYLLWPALLVLAWKRGFNLLTATVALAAVSFLANMFLVTHQASAAAFYLPHARLWELLIGAALACVAHFYAESAESILSRVFFQDPKRSDRQTIGNVLSILGLGLVLLAFVGLERDHTSPNWWSGMTYLRDIVLALGLGDGTSYPGAAALAPTIGTALLILAGPSGWVNRRLLVLRPVVYVGLISYPLYLWHWPLLSFVRITENGVPSVALRVYAVTLSIACAIGTYHLIERPVRALMNRPTVPSVFVLASPVAAVGLVAVLAVMGGRLQSRVPNFALAMDTQTDLPRNDPACRERFEVAGEYCQLYASSPDVTTAILGDSHAANFVPAVGAALASRGENVVHLGQSGCPPLLGIRRLSNDGQDACDEVNGAIIHYVGDHAALRRVLLSYRHAAYLHDGGARYRLVGSDLPARESIERAFEATVTFLLDHGKELWLVLDVPQLDFNITECAGRPFSFEHAAVRQPCGVRRDAVLSQQTVYRQTATALQERHPAIHVFDPLQWMCDDWWCYAAKGSQVLFIDDNHLSLSGSLLFADKFAF